MWTPIGDAPVLPLEADVRRWLCRSRTLGVRTRDASPLLPLGRRGTLASPTVRKVARMGVLIALAPSGGEQGTSNAPSGGGSAATKLVAELWRASAARARHDRAPYGDAELVAAYATRAAVSWCKWASFSLASRLRLPREWTCSAACRWCSCVDWSSTIRYDGKDDASGCLSSGLPSLRVSHQHTCPSNATDAQCMPVGRSVRAGMC